MKISEFADFTKSFLVRKRQFIMYYLTGNLSAVVDFGLLYILTDVLSVFYLLSAGISFVIGTLINFIINKKYTFRNKSRKIMFQYSVFLTSGIIALLLNLGIMFVLVHFFSLWYILAKVVSIIVIFIFGYLFNKHVTYGMIK